MGCAHLSCRLACCCFICLPAVAFCCCCCPQATALGCPRRNEKVASACGGSGMEKVAAYACGGCEWLRRRRRPPCLAALRQVRWCNSLIWRRRYRWVPGGFSGLVALSTSARSEHVGISRWDRWVFSVGRRRDKWQAHPTWIPTLYATKCMGYMWVNLSESFQKGLVA